MTVATMNKLKKLARDCIELDNMIASIKNVKHRNIVVPVFQRIKLAVFEEMETIVLSEQEAEKPLPVLEETDEVANG